MSFYSFDTSAILNGRRDLLPPAVFPSLWANIEELVGSTVIAIDQVDVELSKREDEIWEWAKAQSGLFVPLEEDVQQATMAVLDRCPKLVGVGGQRNAADPFVIGLAHTRGGVVVTEEHRTGKPNKPRMPDACELLDVRCINLVQFVTEQGWTF